MRKNINDFSSRTLFFLVCFILIVASYELNFSFEVNTFICMLVLLISILSLIYIKNNLSILLMWFFIAYSNYSIVVGVYLEPTIRPSLLYNQINDLSTYGVAILQLLIFNIVLFFSALKFEKTKFDSNVFVKNRNKDYLLYFILAISFVVIMLKEYTVVEGSEGSSSSLYEYDLILLILQFYFSGNIKILKSISTLLGFIYILTSLINGTRIEALSCILIICLMNIKNLKKKNIIIAGFIGILLFNFIGNTRGNYDNFFISMQNSFYDLIESKLVFNTCTYAYFPCLAMIDYFKNYDLNTGMYFLREFLVDVIVGNGYNDGNLIYFIRKIYFHNFGGVSTGFFYVWFGSIGAFVFGFIVHFYISLSAIKKDIYKYIYMYFVATVPRWYLYGPLPLFRGILLSLILFVTFSFFHYLNSILFANNSRVKMER